MKKVMILLFAISLLGCEKEPISIQDTPVNYLIGEWRQMDKYNLEWNFKDEKNLERLTVSNDGIVRQRTYGWYEQKDDSLIVVFTMQDLFILEHPPTMYFKIEELEKEDMIWSIDDTKFIFRRL